MMIFKRIPCSDRYIYGVPTPLPQSPQLPPGSATEENLAMLFSVCNHETWRGFVGGQNNNFLHNLHETNEFSSQRREGFSSYQPKRPSWRKLQIRKCLVCTTSQSEKTSSTWAMRGFGALYKTAQIWQTVRTVSNKFWSFSFKLLSTKIKRI